MGQILSTQSFEDNKTLGKYIFEDDGIKVPVYRTPDGKYTYGDNKQEFTFDELYNHIKNITVYGENNVRFHGLFGYHPEYFILKEI